MLRRALDAAEDIVVKVIAYCSFIFCEMPAMISDQVVLKEVNFADMAPLSSFARANYL